MKSRIRAVTILAFLFCVFPLPQRAAAHSPVGNYICELGVEYYQKGNFNDALREFRKALQADPQNQVAREYIAMIQQRRSERDYAPVAQQPQPRVPAPTSEPAAATSRRDQVIAATLDSLSRQNRTVDIASYGIAQPGPKKKDTFFKISGQVKLGVGFEGEDFIWKRANYNLNEKDWRILSGNAYNQYENTYDPAIYDSVKVVIDTPEDSRLGFHADIENDPWSYTGKTDSITIPGNGWDAVSLQLLYWSNTGYTVNQGFFTNYYGDVIGVNELKVKDGKVAPTTVNSAYGNTYDIPELKIERQFNPLRELWVQYKKDERNFIRIFPYALEDQAYTSDDPLRLSNNHSIWEDSPWIRRWQQGHFDSLASPPTYSKGYWDNSLSFITRDSTGRRLTALRGFSAATELTESTLLETTWATPKTIWQDYGKTDTVDGAVRLKQSFSESMTAGLLYTMRLGYTDDNQTDSRNYVLGVDSQYELMPGTALVAEVAGSRSDYDITNSTYRTESRGNAYYLALTSRYPHEPILGKAFEQIDRMSNEPFFSKVRFLATRIDEGFDPTLSTYRQTRRDAYWSRHLHFRTPLDYFYQGMYYPQLKFEDYEQGAIGTGIDLGREVLALRWQLQWADAFYNLFDVRNVHQTDGSYLETVARDEITWDITDRLTAKGFGLYQDMPDTHEDIDPFIYSNQTGLNVYNSQIEDGKDPSLKTGSLGAEYKLTEWLRVNGIYERTNDYTLAYDNFPRGDLITALPVDVYYEYGNAYRRNAIYLYGQEYFPLPPYSYYNVYKFGALIIPMEKLQLYLDYTYNDFKNAGQISDGMNHFGIEIGYLPTPKLGLYLRYTYSRWVDLDKMAESGSKTYGHHNLFFETRYLRNEFEEFVFDYGVSPNYPSVQGQTTDPFGGSLLTIDTQHIIRLYYQRKF